jgi:hypothetical protein
MEYSKARYMMKRVREGMQECVPHNPFGTTVHNERQMGEIKIGVPFRPERRYG